MIPVLFVYKYLVVLRGVSVGFASLFPGSFVLRIKVASSVCRGGHSQ